MNTEIWHYGIKGQKWGIRRFQNPDGTLTPEGIRRYGTLENFQKQTGIGVKKQANDNNTEYLELQNGKKLAMDKKGIYGYMKTGKEVGAHLNEMASWTKKNASGVKADREIYKGLENIASQRKALAKKYGKMKYSDIDFHELRSIEKMLDKEEGLLLSKAIRKNLAKISTYSRI